MSDQAYDVRLRNVEHWQQRHDGECTVRNKEQDTVNKAVWKRLDVHLSRIHGLEKRVAWITGGASAVGAILGAILGNLVKLLFVLLLALLWCATAEAQCYPVRVVVKDCGLFGCRLAENLGTSVAIGRHYPGKEIFLTAGHCLRGDVHRVYVGIEDEWRPAAVLGSVLDDSRDLAVLGVDWSGEIRCAPIATDDPVAGVPVNVAGFPGGVGFRRRDAVVAQHAYLTVDLVVSIPTKPGESGGGIFNERGELVGIISATGPPERPVHTLATGVSRIRRFLETSINGVPSCGKPTQPPPSAPPAAPLPDRTAELLGKIAALEQRIAELENRPPPQNGKDGEDGANGKDGQPGTVTVVIKDDDSVFRHEGLKSGSTVEVDINRFKKE